MNQKPKPTPPTISVFCGSCGQHAAEIMLPDRRLVCKPCAKKEGFAVRFEISKSRLRKIKAGIGRKIGRDITAGELGALLGITGKNQNSIRTMVLGMLSDSSPRKISAQVAESALRLEQLSKNDLEFLFEEKS